MCSWQKVQEELFHMGFLISISPVRFSELSWCINFLRDEQKRSPCSWMPEGDEYWHVTAVSVAFLLWNSETNVSYVSQLSIIHSQPEPRWQKSFKCWSFAFALCLGWAGPPLLYFTSSGPGALGPIPCVKLLDQQTTKWTHWEWSESYVILCLCERISQVQKPDLPRGSTAVKSWRV